MPVGRMPIDGLWRCLCPAIDSLATAQAAYPLHSVKKLLTRPHIAKGSNSRIRQFHSSAAARLDDAKGETPISVSSLSFKSPSAPAKSPPDGSITPYRSVTGLVGRTVPSPNTQYVPPVATSETSKPGILTERAFSRYNSLGDVPLAHLHGRLRLDGSSGDEYHHIAELVEYLITERGEEPALVHYHALIRINADAEHGSAEAVERLLKEMKEEGIGADSGLYHAALQALATHPDYLLRNQVMQEMKERWFGLSPEGWHSLVVGLLRDRQFEAAMEKLEQMQSDDIHVQPWLYDIFLYQLCEAGELDEAFRMLRYRFENRRTEISTNIWHYLLDKFSSNYHYAGTKFVWKARIQTSYLVPTDSICVSTLNLGAREGDPGLATSAIRILAARRSALSPFHYEALLASYAKAQDIKTALRILTIMAKAGLEPDSNTTRPLYLYLTQSDSLPDKAWQLLKSLTEDGHAVPSAAVIVVIEAKIQRGQFPEAVEFYKELHTICDSGPNTETFNILLQGTTRHSTKSMGMFFASEMRSLGVRPDRLTYDRLILVCLLDNDYEDAFRYLEEMKTVGAEKEEDGQVGWWMRPGTVSMLTQRCAKAGDSRAWGLLDEFDRRNMVDKWRLRKLVEETWKRRGKEERREPESQTIAQWGTM